MIRFLDVVFSFVGLLLCFPLLLLLLIVGYFDTGSPLFCQIRLGQYKRPFVLIKFRTMKLNTASVATHLADTSAITKYGSFLRRTKLDELPQLWNVLIGDMSMVGPRPCLPSQEELVYERDICKVFNVRPGITGLAQVKEIDMSTPKLLAQTDKKMLTDLHIRNYFKYIVLTVFGKGAGDRIKH